MRQNKKLQRQVVRFFAALIVALPAAWVIAAANQLFARLLGQQPSFQPDLLSFVAAFISVLALAWLSQWIAATASYHQFKRQQDQDQEGELDLATAEEGEVKWFSRDRGYGFLVRDTGEEVFVHFRAIRGRGRRKFLQEGQKVRFNIANGENGKPKAVNVLLME